MHLKIGIFYKNQITQITLSTYQFTILKNKQERDGLHTLTKTLQYIRMLKNPVNTQLMKNMHLVIYNRFCSP